MSITTLMEPSAGLTPDDSGDSQAEQYRHLSLVPDIIEAPAPPEPIGHEHFAARAQDILSTIATNLKDKPLRDAIEVVTDNYEANAEDGPELQQLSHLLVNARKQAIIQDRLNDDRSALHGNRLSHEERVSVGHHYETLRREACEYNHALREFIESNTGDLDRNELTGWLSRASQGRSKWAEGEVTGAVSEIAVHAALQGMPDLRGLRHGDVNEDLKGIDFLGYWQGRLVTFDAKTGWYAPLTEQMHGNLHIELSIPRINSFRLTPKELEGVRSSVRRALRGSVYVAEHATHAHF